MRNKISFEWNGEKADLLMTMEVIERLESESDPYGIQSMISQGKTPTAKIARLISVAMNLAGLEVSAEEIRNEFFNGSAESVSGLAASIVLAMVPVNEDIKKAWQEEGEQQEIGSYYRAAYGLAVVHYGVQPSEFWRMTPNEFAIIHEQKRPKHINGIHEDDFHDIIRRRKELEAQGVKVG